MTTIPDLPAGFTRLFSPSNYISKTGVCRLDGSVHTVSQSTIGDGTGMMAEIAKFTCNTTGIKATRLIASSPSSHPKTRPTEK